MRPTEKNETVLAIEAALKGPGKIPAEQVRKWMKDRDIEAQGAVAQLIIYPPHCDRIQPPLDEDDYEGFLPSYYDVCLRLDPEGKSAHGRYEVAWQIVDWFQAVPPDDDVNDHTFVVFLRDWLAERYKMGNEAVQEAITRGILQIILEEARWRTFFESWKSDDELKPAWDAAMAELAENEGNPGK